MSIIEAKELSFSYDNKNKVIDNISFNIEEGSINVLLGPNGSGKTTLINLLLKLERLQSGDIIINNKSIDDYSIKELARDISYVFQDNDSKVEFNVLDYILFGRNAYMKIYNSYTDKDYEFAIECAKKCKIEKLLDCDVDKISGGERQLVRIARALVQDSRIIVLDEPTSALDLKNQVVVLKTLKEISKDKNKTIIFTTHNPNQALGLDANVLVMNCGKIEKQGKAREVVTVNSLKDIYGKELVYTNELDYNEVTYKMN